MSCICIHTHIYNKINSPKVVSQSIKVIMCNLSNEMTTVKANDPASIVQSFTCETCGTTFTSRQALREHNIDRHSRRVNDILPGRGSTVLVLGVTAGVIAAGFAVYYLTKVNRR